MPSLGGWEIVILVVVVLLLFGAKKLPDMARSVGQSARIFKGEMKGMKKDGEEDKPAAQAPPAQLPPVQAATQNAQETPTPKVEQPEPRQ